jgi:hypothetical protein
MYLEPPGCFLVGSLVVESPQTFHGDGCPALGKDSKSLGADRAFESTAEESQPQLDTRCLPTEPSPRERPFLAALYQPHISTSDPGRMRTTPCSLQLCCSPGLYHMPWGEFWGLHLASFPTVSLPGKPQKDRILSLVPAVFFFFWHN